MAAYTQPIEILSDEDDEVLPQASGSRLSIKPMNVSGSNSLSFGGSAPRKKMMTTPLYIDSDTDADTDSDISLPGASSLPAKTGRPTQLSSALPSSARPRSTSSKTASTSTVQAARKTSALLDLLSDNTLLTTPVEPLVPASQDSIQIFTSDPVLSPVRSDRKGKARAPGNNAEDGNVKAPVKKPRTSKGDAASSEATAARKEIAALEKARQMQEKQMEKARFKAEKEAEKSLAKKLADVNKLRVSKSEAVHEINLYCAHDLSLPTSALAGALPEIKRKLEEHNSAIHFMEPDASTVPGLIRFRRFVKATWNTVLKRWDPLPVPKWQDESTLLVVVDAASIVAKVQEGPDVLGDWVREMKAKLGMRGKQQLFLVIRGLTKYYRKNSALANSEFRAMARAQLDGASSSRADGGFQVGRVTKEEVEKQLVRVQVAEGCYLVEVETTEDVENWIWNLTADVAIRPYKLVSRSHLFFCASESNKKAIEPSKTLELMLGEVQGITESAAAGITDDHPTFRRLMEAFERAERVGGIPQGESLLQNCEIRNLKDGTANGRRLNTALAKRVFHNMRGLDSLALS